MNPFLARPINSLLPYLRTIAVGEFVNTVNRMPAVPDVHLVIYLRGSASLLHETGTLQPIPSAFVAGPSEKPVLFEVAEGARYITVFFRPGGFSAIFGLPADLLAGQLLELDNLLPPHEVAALVEALVACRNAQQKITLLETLLMRRLSQRRKMASLLPYLHARQLLSPASSLAASLGLSTRQLERRFLAHVGMPLRDYRRMARFAMLLPALLDPGKRSTGLAHLAQDAYYVDQAHLTRDFRQLVGDTPGRFKKNIVSKEPGNDFWIPDSIDFERHFQW